MSGGLVLQWKNYLGIVVLGDVMGELPRWQLPRGELSLNPNAEVTKLVFIEI